MELYRLAARRMPWGDYGRILASGMSAHLPRKGGLIQLERTAPFVPPITFPGIDDIVVTDAFRGDIEASGLTGFTFAPVIKARVVMSSWESWNKAALKPRVPAPDGEPESYILAAPHEPALAGSIGPLWELVPEVAGTIERRPTGAGRRDVDVVLTSTAPFDLFRAAGVRYNYGTQRALEWFGERAADWVQGLPARVERGAWSDDDLLDALRQRARVAPCNPSSHLGRTSAGRPAGGTEVERTESQLGFRLPSLLQRLYLEVADGGVGPGYGLFPAGEHTAANGQPETLSESYAKLSIDPRWPARLLPLCDWGCANWSCLDCRADDGAIVTFVGEEGFTNTGHTLRSWLGAWLDGHDLWKEMFETVPTKTGINPFTKQPIQMMGRGKAKGEPWP